MLSSGFNQKEINRMMNGNPNLSGNTSMNQHPISSFPIPNELKNILKPTQKEWESGPQVYLLAGDASDRKFYRVYFGEKSTICMNFPSWKDGYGGDPVSWLGMHEALSQYKIPVPEVYFVDEENRNIWTQDFGDCFLNQTEEFSILDDFQPNCHNTILRYKEAIELLVKVQYPSVPPILHPAQNRFFDHQKLYFEMDFFFVHFVHGFFKLNLNSEQESMIRQDLTNLCHSLGNAPRVLCHRDYHVRNLMIYQNAVKWIDFQDARMGPHTYDLASLIRDCYIPITQHTRTNLLQHYFDLLCSTQQKNEIPVTYPNQTNFDIEFEQMATQRNIKALGSFGYLASQKNKLGYLSYVKYTIQMLFNAFTFQTQSSFLAITYPNLSRFIHGLFKGKEAEILSQKIDALSIKSLEYHQV
jgi:aminoglycoside/choline kinase family phosphotransferase